MASAGPIIKIGGSTTQYSVVFIPAPAGWQPPAVNGTYQVTNWDFEWVNGQIYSLVANCITTLASVTSWIKVYIPASTIDPAA